MSGTPTPSDAVARLQRSRSRLRQALVGPPEAAPTRPAAAERDAAAAERQPPSPAAGLASAALKLWWTRHPMRPAAEAAGDVATLALQPVAAKHPFGLVAAAVAIGGG